MWYAYPWATNRNSAFSSKLKSWTLNPKYGITAASTNPVKTKLPGQKLILVFVQIKTKDEIWVKNNYLNIDELNAELTSTHKRVMLRTLFAIPRAHPTASKSASHLHFPADFKQNAWLLSLHNDNGYVLVNRRLVGAEKLPYLRNRVWGFLHHWKSR